MDSNSTTVDFDRRQVYRPFLERLNPIASPRALVERDLIVSRDHDPRDAAQPPIHIAFADTAELSRGAQMALVGGTGSGKTTELLLTYQTLKRHGDAVNIFVDLADYTDLSELNSGAILATAGMRLHSRLKEAWKEKPKVKSAYTELRELAFGKTTWVSPHITYPDYDDDDGLVPADIPGLMKLRFPALRR